MLGEREVPSRDQSVPATPDFTQAPPAALSWPKRIAFSATSAILALALFVGLGELGLRLFARFTSYNSAPFRRYDPLVGIALLPNKRIAHSRGCFTGLVVTNRWGMRDRDRSLDKSPGEFRIALLGDSAVEAVQVKPEEVANIRMEELLRKKGYQDIEVLNFGVEGIGTTQELLIYKDRVRRFHPDLVILLWVDNDVMNNSSMIQPRAYGIHTWYCPYYDLEPDGKLILRPVQRRAFNGVRSFLESHSLLVYYGERTWLKVNVPGYRWKGLPVWYGLYADSLDTEWEQAWQITEKVMALLNQTVENDGIKLAIEVHPEFYEIDPDWRRRVAKEVEMQPSSLPALTPRQTEERLKQIATRNHLTLDFLYPYFQAYRNSHRLRWPYFSFTCDPHHGALGNEVEAEAIVRSLEEHHLLPLPAGNGGAAISSN